MEALPNNYYIFLEYITVLYELGDHDVLIKVVEGPRPPQADFNPLLWNYAGLAWLKNGETAKAGNCFRKSLEIDPENSVSWYNMGNLHHAAFQETGDIARQDQAEESFRKAVVLDAANGSPSYMWAWFFSTKRTMPGRPLGSKRP